jgi:pseudouridine synthase
VVFNEDDGRKHTSAPAQVSILRYAGVNCWLALTIHEGRKRQVRRMLAATGSQVLQLVRVGIGPMTLGDVPVGKWRYLTDEEVKALM